MVRSFCGGICLLALLMAHSLCLADSLTLHPQYIPAQMKGRTKSIEPDKSAYGIPFGAAEAELTKAFGDPTGVIVLSETTKALLYGRSHMFVLKNGKFRELMLSETLMDWELSQRIEGNPFFDNGQWSIAPGLSKEMSFEDVAKAIGKPNAAPSYQFSFDTENATIELRFSSMSTDGGARSYRLHAVAIKNFGS
jgi:hypothetical protein